MKIKTFKHYNDKIINEFLKQTEGKIVNYNPIVIEYSEDKKFKDPYEGYDAYFYKCEVTYTSMDNIIQKKFEYKDQSKVYTFTADTVLIHKRTGAVKFMSGKHTLIKTTSNNYVELRILDSNKIGSYDLETILNKNHQAGRGSTTITYNFDMYADSVPSEHFYLKGFLEDLGCEKINYD